MSMKPTGQVEVLALRRAFAAIACATWGLLLVGPLGLTGCGNDGDAVRTRVHQVIVGHRDDDAGLDDGGLDDAGDECNPACPLTPSSCGDGAQNDPTEECDDGNSVDDDACSNGCTLNVCGNGRQDVGEECDDANDVDDDECANGCTHNRCRNGRLDPGEECDDGNRLSDDGCTNACVSVDCGDGVVYAAYEECDDKNAIDDDACSNLCKANVCGNNRIDVHEVCDGNALPEGLTGACRADCSGATSLDTCDPCRRQDARCTDYLGSGVNLVDSCLTTAPVGVGEDFIERCTALSTCITQSRCDLLDAEIRVGCYCGAGNSLVDCENDTVPANGPCVQEFLDAAGCASQAKPSQCVINLASDLTLPVGFAIYLAECDRTYCLAECRPEE